MEKLEVIELRVLLPWDGVKWNATARRRRYQHVEWGKYICLIKDIPAGMIVVMECYESYHHTVYERIRSKDEMKPIAGTHKE